MKYLLSIIVLSLLAGCGTLGVNCDAPDADQQTCQHYHVFNPQR